MNWQVNRHRGTMSPCAPEESEHCLSDPCEEGCGERQPAVLKWILDGVDLFLEESAEQQRHDGHWTDGYVPGTAHQGVYQRRDEATICEKDPAKLWSF